MVRTRVGVIDMLMSNHHNQPEVLPLSPEDYTTAGQTLGKAFLHDPLWTATISDSERGPDALVDMFT